MKERYGFTLIELLAVIVILAVIALIATPVILGIIDDAKKSAFKDSAYGMEHAAELLYAQNLMEQENKTILFLYEEGVESSQPGGYQLNYKGEKPKNGQLVIEKDGTIRLSLHNGKYCITKTSLSDVFMEEKEIGECNLPDLPVIIKSDGSGAAIPELAENMIPIKWDGSKWVKADVTVSKDWYDYNAKKWANAVTVTESSRSKYLSAEVDTEIKEEDILTYLVWVPRYKYKLFNVEAIEMEAQTIEVVFEDKSVTKSKGSINGEYLTHPAFTFGNTELNGIWVGKFETTGSIDTPCSDEVCTTAELTIKPNLTSVRMQAISSLFYATRSMQKSGNIYGFNNTVDTHMMKNTEWGSVAYLSYSKYGKNSQIWINNNSDYITGCVGTQNDSDRSTSCENTYDSDTGIKGSTTGNIYGIYDMNGGTYEYVMGAMYNSDNKTVIIGNSEFNQNIIDSSEMNQYINKYTYGEISDNQDAYNHRILGDATGETRGWNSNLDHFIYNSFSWFLRGGFFGSKQAGGVFNFTNHNGTGGGHALRIVITA